MPDDPRFSPRHKQETFIFSKTYKLALEFTSPLFSVTRVLFWGVKQLRCEGGQSPPAHAEVKNERSYISPSSNTPSWHQLHLFHLYSKITVCM